MRKCYSEQLKIKKFLDFLTSKYGHGYEFAINELSKEFLNLLKNLPNKKIINLTGNLEILLCHGSPKSIDEYIYPDASPDLIKNILNDFDCVVYGHTHYQSVFKFDNQKIMFNPGSVGQPRERGKKELAGVLLILRQIKYHFLIQPMINQMLLMQLRNLTKILNIFITY